MFLIDFILFGSEELFQLTNLIGKSLFLSLQFGDLIIHPLFLRLEGSDLGQLGATLCIIPSIQQFRKQRSINQTITK